VRGLAAVGNLVKGVRESVLILRISPARRQQLGILLIHIRRERERWGGRERERE
jgi:hypothetical protein